MRVGGTARLPIVTQWRVNACDGVLPAVLRELYEEAGVRPNRFLVVYCRTGIEAAHVYFTARTVGYPLRLDDGSYAEWSAKEKLPVRRGVTAD